jgi:hypothetical protein
MVEIAAAGGKVRGLAVQDRRLRAMSSSTLCLGSRE